MRRTPSKFTAANRLAPTKLGSQVTLLSWEQVEESAAWRRAIRNRGRDAEFNLRTAAHSAPDIQLAADLLGPFPHSAHTVVTGAALFQNLGWNTLPIIANA
jgi:hypothetical protein